jgi:hypothetical protein
LRLSLIIALTFLSSISFNTHFCYAEELEYPDQEDSNILIFSSSHGGVAYQQEKEGVLEIGITSFKPILQMDLNGVLIDSDKDTKAQLSHAYSLEEKETEFKVTVVTAAGKAQKRFTVFYGKKSKPSVRAFQLISILESANIDNVNSAADSASKKAASKTVLTLVPGYTMQMGETSRLRLRAILLREKYAEKDYFAKEILYTQVSVSWLEKTTLLGDIFGGLGLNDIGTDNESLLRGENESAVESFINAGLNQELNDVFSWDLKWTYKLIEAKNEPANADDNSDGGAWSLKSGLKYKIAGFTTAAKIGYTATDAKGKYQDNASTQFKLKLAYPLERITPSVSYTAKDKTMKAEDARKGLTPNYKTGTLTLKADYKMFPSFRLGFSYQNVQNTSNVGTAEYTATTIAMSAMHIF